MILVLIFRDKIAETTPFPSILQALFYGLRFDSMVAGYAVLIPFLMSLSCGFVNLRKLANRVRGLIGILFIILTIALFGVTIGYFREYDDQFNHFLFGFIYDDTGAILTTIWKEYHPILSFIAMGVVLLPGIRLKRRFLAKPFFSDEFLRAHPFSLTGRVMVTFIVVAFFVLALRGSIGRRPAQRHDAAVTGDEFLNKIILNPHLALKYALKDHNELARSDGIRVFLPDGDVKAALTHLFPKAGDQKNLDDYLLKTASGPKNRPARHIFLIVMESYDAWPFMERYASLGLTNGLKALAKDGLHIKTFLPASSGTMTSLAAIMSGMADAGIQTNLQKNSMSPYPTSVAESFRRLGYRTRFFYGGKLSWRRISYFSRNQGFEETYGASHIGHVLSGNEWGVDDEYLFDFVAEKVNDDEPSFNLIMTTTYHPPYDIDVYEKGYTVRDVPDDLKGLFEDTVDLNTLGHLWYADQAILKFVRGVEDTLGQPLFAMTGDHSGRKFINSRPDFFERSAVPFILYGREVLKGIFLPEGVAGGHLDIGPTLIELAAPQGFKYASVGSNLLEPKERFLGVGRGKVVGADFMAEISSPPKIFPLEEGKPPLPLPPLDELSLIHNAFHGVSWWRIREGSVLPGSDASKL